MSENVLQVMLIAFMFFLCALCLFAVIVIARDIVYESAKNRRDREREERLERLEARERLKLQEAKPTLEQAAKPLAEPEKTCEESEPNPGEKTPEVVEESVAPLAEVAATDDIVEDREDQDDQEEQEVEDGAVSFNRVNLTLEEKYATLSSEFKRFFDDIVKHALSKSGVKEFKKSGSYDYKIGAYKVLKLTVKRGEIVCYFNFIDRDFNSYANESNVKIKQSATVVRVLEASAVGVVKDGVDLVCQQIAEDKDRKRALANEKRREKRRLQKEQQP